jgi:hypothetical protein
LTAPERFFIQVMVLHGMHSMLCYAIGFDSILLCHVSDSSDRKKWNGMEWNAMLCYAMLLLLQMAACVLCVCAMSVFEECVYYGVL